MGCGRPTNRPEQRYLFLDKFYKESYKTTNKLLNNFLIKSLMLCHNSEVVANLLIYYEHNIMFRNSKVMVKLLIYYEHNIVFDNSITINPSTGSG